MEKLIYVLLIFLLIVSCKSSHEVIYTKNKREDPNMADEYGNHSYLFIVFDNSLKNKRIVVKDYKLSEYCTSLNDTIYYEGTLGNSDKNIKYLKIVPTYNNKEVSISINKDTIVIHRFFYGTYRYIVVNKIKKRYIYTFTNKYPADLDEKWLEFLKDF